LRIGNIDTQNEVFVIAEVGNNHEGSYALAEELVGLAAETGVHAIKFQTFKTEHYVSRNDEARFARLKSFELSYGQFENLAKAAKKAGLLFISTPFDLGSADFLDGIVSAFKIASGDNNFYPLIERIASKGKPVILSGGLATTAELNKSKRLIESTWKKNAISESLAILHCVSSYPVKPEEVNMTAITELKKELGCTIGYSDHAMGIQASLMAVALGARIVEKHFTKDKNYSSFRDHQLSADPKDMAELVQKVKEVNAMLGTGVKQAQPSERDGIKMFRRSIAVRRDMKPGDVVAWEDLTWIRPAEGLLPGEENQVLGKTLKKAIKMGDFLLPEHLS
jgi:sialic acid synthase SpsE